MGSLANMALEAFDPLRSGVGLPGSLVSEEEVLVVGDVAVLPSPTMVFLSVFRGPRECSGCELRVTQCGGLSWTGSADRSSSAVLC